jgi:hypothetical protein
VERRYEPLDEGLARLADAARSHRHLPIEPFCDALVATLADPAVKDDIALVCAELTPVPEDRIVLHMAPEPDALAGLRGELRAWLAERAIEERAAADLLVAVGEACANAVEHAYVGVSAALVDRVDVSSGRTGTRVTLEKRMAGRDPAADLTP